jgi:hypothetical protein
MKIKLWVGLILVVFLLIVAPWMLIWALNTLFKLGIPFTLSTWAAASVIIGVWSNRGTRGND